MRSSEHVSAADQYLPERILAFWEVMSVISSVLIAEWLVLSLARNNRAVFLIPIGLAFVLIVSSHWLRHETLRDIGIRWDNFGAALLRVTLPTCVIAGLILFTGWRLGSLHLAGSGTRAHYLFLPFWALLQQYVMQGFVNRRCQLVFRKGWLSVTFVAAVFGLLHLPNPNFAVITLVAGFVWATVYQRTPNLFALAFSHSVLAIVLSLSLPLTWLHNLRVGFKYFR